MFTHLQNTTDIIDYQIVSSNKVNAYLKRGYKLLCPPKYQIKVGWIQPMVKIHQKISLSELNELEYSCVKYFGEGLSFNQVASKLNRSPSTIKQLMSKLRKRYRCKTTMQLLYMLNLENIK